MGRRRKTPDARSSARRTVIGAVLSLILMLAIMVCTIYLQRRAAAVSEPETAADERSEGAEDPQGSPVSALDRAWILGNTPRAANV